MDEVRIVYTPIFKLAGWKRNPKLHDIPGIQASLRRHGFVEPIVLDDRTQRIVAGHGRLEAVIAMHAAGEEPPRRVVVKDGAWLVPVLRGASFEDESEAEAYLVGSNFLTAKEGWDEAELAAMLAEIPDLTGTGIDDAELERLRKLAEAAIPSEDDFEGSRPEEGGPSRREGPSRAGIRIVLGPYAVKLERAKFDAWIDTIRAAVGHEKGAVEAEIARRLGL